MKTPVVLGFYGHSNIGKTTLIEKMIRDLTARGFRVAAIKKTDQSISMDREGKDTHRFGQAGANPVVFSTSIETTWVNTFSKTERQIIGELEKVDNLDFIIIEGSKDAIIPKIRFGDHEERENTLFTYNGDYQQLFTYLLDKANSEVNNG